MLIWACVYLSMAVFVFCLWILSWRLSPCIQYLYQTCVFWSGTHYGCHSFIKGGEFHLSCDPGVAVGRNPLLYIYLHVWPFLLSSVCVHCSETKAFTASHTHALTHLFLLFLLLIHVDRVQNKIYPKLLHFFFKNLEVRLNKIYFLASAHSERLCKFQAQGLFK